MPSWAQVRISSVSSRVPSPPGSATKPSASEAMVALRSCMLSTRRISLSPGWASSRGGQRARDDANHLTARPSSTASARAPIKPTEPPPYTSPSCRSTSVRPRSRAASTYSVARPGIGPAEYADALHDVVLT